MKQLIILARMVMGLLPSLYNYYWVNRPRRDKYLKLVKNELDSRTGKK
jgi:hypothetical protein